MFDFVTVGGATRDISFFTDQGLLMDNRSDILRQKMLAFELGAKIKVDKFFYSYGGGAANAAVCLANFGFRTACLAPVGDDQNGRLIIKNLLDKKVSSRLVVKMPGEESGSSFILIAPSGERIIFAQRGANADFVISGQSLAALKSAKNIYIASLAGGWRQNLKRIFSVVSPGQNVYWNPGAAQLTEGLDGISGFLKKTKVLALNQDEATELVFRTPAYAKKSRRFLDEAQNLLRIIRESGPRIVVITKGPDGVIVFDGERFYERAARDEKKKVDSTGVGDVFNSTFAAGLEHRGGDIGRALDLALRNAAAKVAHLGAQNGLIKLK